jgi:hypothetical protein
VTATAEPSSAHRLVELRFKPLWLYVDEVREFCGFFARATFEDAEVGERVRLVVHELVENAIRYGDDRELELRLERSEGAVVIRVANTTSEERAAKLAALFAEMMSSPAAVAYANALQTAVTKPAIESGLGLPRIRAEGQVDLELEMQPGRVCITARGAA